MSVNKPALRLLWVAAATFFCVHYSLAQPGINAGEIEPLIKEWTYAHNEKNIASFGKVYSEKVLYLTRQLTSAECIREKQKLFREFPDYRQRITSGITYKIYTAGVIKCDFIKEVIKDSVLWTYPAYLLVRYENKRYTIVGESDDNTDKTLQHYLRLVEQMNITSDEHQDVVLGDTSENNVTARNSDSAATLSFSDSASDLAVVEDSSATVKAFDSTAEADTFDPVYVSDDAVTIPVLYIYLFVALLGLTGIVMLLSGSGSRRKKQMAGPSASEKHNVYDKTQSAQFEKFVLTLFDPLYFRAFRTKKKKVLSHGDSDFDNHLELEMEFSHKDTRATFAIECVYIKELKYKDILIASPQKVRAYRQLDEDDNDLYLVLGLLGRPDDPKEIYFIPVRAIVQPYITYTALQPYRKYGMFFYNTESRRLQ
jgi:hypothetical protein